MDVIDLHCIVFDNQVAFCRKLVQRGCSSPESRIEKFYLFYSVTPGRCSVPFEEYRMEVVN